MGLIYWGEVDAASDVTMSAVVDAPGTRTRASIIALITPIAAGIISGDATVTAAAEAAAAAAVSAALSGQNIVRAFPEEPLDYTSNRLVPIRWVHKTLNDPVGETVGDTIAGAWSGSTQRRGDVPVLSPGGKLDASQVPDSVATRDFVVEAVAAGSGRVVVERLVRGEFPIFGARVAAAREAGAAVAVVFAGSSTAAETPGFVTRLTALLQGVFPVPSPTMPQWSPTANFTTNSGAGVHGYSAGEGGAVAADYLTNTRSDRVAALTPAMLMHMVGANDYWQSVDPAIYKSQMLARLQYLDTKLTAPCQHVLVHPYPRAGLPSSSRYAFPWAAYRDALGEIAASRTDTVLIDLSAEYAAVGVDVGYRADPLDLIRTDDTHQTPVGYRFMADLLAGYLTT